MYALFFLLLISWFLSLFVYTPLTNAPLWEREGKVNLKEKKQTNKNASLFFKHSLSKGQSMSTSANGSSFSFRPHGDKINRKSLSLFRGTSRV